MNDKSASDAGGFQYLPRLIGLVGVTGPQARCKNGCDNGNSSKYCQWNLLIAHDYSRKIAFGPPGSMKNRSRLFNPPQRSGPQDVSTGSVKLQPEFRISRGQGETGSAD